MDNTKSKITGSQLHHADLLRAVPVDQQMPIFLIYPEKCIEIDIHHYKNGTIAALH